MITAEEFVLEIDNTIEQKNFRLGVVADLFENSTAKIQFDGEDAPSEKQYAYLASYMPKKEDRVLLGILGGTYVILGKVSYNVSPEVEEEIDRYLFDLKKVIMKKGLSVSGDTDLNNLTTDGVAINGDMGISGTAMAQEVSASGQVAGGSFYTGGDMSAGGEGSIGGTFRHTGDRIGVFRKSPVTKTSLSPFTNQSTFTLNDAYNGINNIVNIMRTYGFF